MLSSRQQIIDANRAVEITSVDHSVLNPGQQVYVIRFSGNETQLVQSGIYNEMRDCSHDSFARRNLVQRREPLFCVKWNGDTQESKFPASRLGLTLTENTGQIVVTSLTGIALVDRRPHRQRDAHPID